MKYEPSEIGVEKKAFLAIIKQEKPLIETTLSEEEYKEQICSRCRDMYPGKNNLEQSWYQLGYNTRTRKWTLHENLTANLLLYIDFVKEIGKHEHVDDTSLTHLYNKLFVKNNKALNADIIATHTLHDTVVEESQQGKPIKNYIRESIHHIFGTYRHEIKGEKK